MASLANIGDVLDGSGWTHALAQSNIATPGTAESFLKTTHVTRTRHTQQVTAVHCQYCCSRLLCLQL